WFLRKEGLAKKFSHISTGGDAMLMFLSGEKMPGIESLN
ncbi:MAG: phosphoglycerate kinase, partial [bacterium]|nr:phosphoglycerate kinase [bacterium]